MRVIMAVVFLGAFSQFAVGQGSGLNSDDAKRIIKHEYDVVADKFSWWVEMGAYRDSKFVRADPPKIMKFEYSWRDSVLVIDGQKQEGGLSQSEAKALGGLLDQLEVFSIQKTLQLTIKQPFIPGPGNWLPPLFPVPPKPPEEKSKPVPASETKPLKVAFAR